MKENSHRKLHREITARAERGAVLLMVLVTVVVTGLTAGIAGQSWRSIVQQAKEEELLWRGQQYRSAIESYFQTRQGARNMYPRELDDLVRDNRFPEPVRHIRRLYQDPMTGEDWVVIKASDGGIAGVRSTSRLRPFRQKGFAKELAALEGSNSYQDWEFVFVPAQTRTQMTNPAAGTPGSVTIPGNMTTPGNLTSPRNLTAPGRRSPAPDPGDVLPPSE